LILIWITLILLLCLLLLYAFKRRKKSTILKEKWKTGFSDGWEFEKFIAEVFKNAGYRSTLTKGSHDFGADLIIKKRKVSYAIQIKYYSNPITLKALEEALVAAAIYGVDRIGVVTNGEIPQSLKKFAQEIEKKTFVKKVILIGKNDIESMLNGKKTFL